MSSLWSSSNRWLAWFHRWAGVVLCLLFAMWFASGAVLHFVAFPSLSLAEQRANSDPIDVSRVLITPSEALGRVTSANDLRLLSMGGQPIYALQSPDHGWVGVAADTGQPLTPLSAATARVVAEQFGHAAAHSIDGPLEYDQWVVHQHFDPYRPLYRVRLDDRLATDLYVSASTGEVVQRTHRDERLWNWTGAVIHWIYFTPLRKSWSAWNQVVWWVSLLALLSSSVGVWLGIIRFIANRAAGRKGISPFRGWMRWHHIVGLFASLIVLTWMLSGWLSMDHGRLFSFGNASADQTTALRGLTLGEIAQSTSLESLRQVAPASEISFNAVAGHPFLTGYGPLYQGARILYLDDGTATLHPSLPGSLLFAGLNHVWPGAVRSEESASSVDALYRRAESTTDSAQGFLISGPSSLRVYIDRYSGRFVAVMDPSRRGYAWIYYALHTLQLPGLIEHPELRTFLVLTLLALGFAASATGVVLSVKRLKREFA
jgi:uncharacterized iron-regulated membrane protein